MQTWNNYQQSMTQMPYPFTNVAYVTSLEEALIRTTQFGSDMIYFNQDKNEFYRIRVEMDGRKSYLVFTYTLPNSVQPTEALTLEGLATRIGKLEKLLAPTEQHEVTENAKLDG